MSEPRDPQGAATSEGSAERPVERLLRAALEARADEIGVHDLRRAQPPAGNVRRSRHLYTVVLPLIGVAAAGALGYLSFSDTVNTADRGVSPGTTTTLTPAPTVPPLTRPSAGGTAGASASGAPSGAATATSVASSTGASTATAPAGAHAIPGRYVPAAWLKPSEYPLHSVFPWTPAGGSTPTTTTGPFQWIYSCGTGEPTAELHTEAISTLNFTASRSTGSVVQQANQVISYFKDAATATTALNTIQQDYQGCAARENKAAMSDMATGKTLTWTVTRTATSGSGFAYRTELRTPDGKPGAGLNIGSDAQELFVRSGNVIANSAIVGPDRAVGDRALIGVLSDTPTAVPDGSSWLGRPAMELRRAAEHYDPARTFAPARSLRLARVTVELSRVVPALLSGLLQLALAYAMLTVWVLAGSGVAILAGGFLMCAGGVVAGAITTAAKWVLMGRFVAARHPLWSSFVWRNELWDVFVETLARPWLVQPATGTPVLNWWLRSMGARIGRGVWCETHWFPEPDLITVADGAVVNRGCVLQTHLFHDRVMRLEPVVLGRGSVLGPHSIVLPGSAVGEAASVGAGSLVMAAERVPGHSRWQGTPITRMG